MFQAFDQGTFFQASSTIFPYLIMLITFLIIFAAMLISALTAFGSALVVIPLLSILFGAKFAIPFIHAL